MAGVSLTADERRGVRASLLVVMSVLVLFVVILVAGRPIKDFGAEPASVGYALIVYVPVMVMCLLAYRRIGR